MYSSSLIGQQWWAAIDHIDAVLGEEFQANGLDYMPDIDDLLDRRKRLTDALKHSGELPTVEA